MLEDVEDLLILEGFQGQVKNNAEIDQLVQIVVKEQREREKMRLAKAEANRAADD